jgi:hypothetical protein
VQAGGVGMMMLGIAGEVLAGEAGEGEQEVKKKRIKKEERSLRISNFEMV